MKLERIIPKILAKEDTGIRSNNSIKTEHSKITKGTSSNDSMGKKLKNKTKIFLEQTMRT